MLTVVADLLQGVACGIFGIGLAFLAKTGFATRINLHEIRLNYSTIHITVFALFTGFWSLIILI
jgi:hypothetical protein